MWWNSFKLHDFVYVLMQGFVQERHFDLPLPRSSSILDVPSSAAAAETTSGSGSGTPGSLPSSCADSTATTTTSSSSSKDDSVPLDLMIISRRGIERPGLRYQRRGINDEGGVANFVETEFVVRAEVRRLRSVVLSEFGFGSCESAKCFGADGLCCPFRLLAFRELGSAMWRATFRRGEAVSRP